MTWFDFLLWVPYTLYFAAFVPQIFKNHREKSTDGLSSSMVVVRFSADLLYVLCAYLLALPLVYKVMIPLCCIAMAKLGVQEYWYSEESDERNRLLWVYAGITVSVVLLGFVGTVMPVMIGTLCGWGAMILYCSAELPQLYQNYDRKSLEGYSFALPILIAAGSMLEVFLVIALRLPRQPLYAALRGVLFFCIYTAQYVKYHLIGEEA